MDEEHITRLNDVRKLIDILIRLVGAFSCQVQLTKHHETRGKIFSDCGVCAARIYLLEDQLDFMRDPRKY